MFLVETIMSFLTCAPTGYFDFAHLSEELSLRHVVGLVECVCDYTHVERIEHRVEVSSQIIRRQVLGHYGLLLGFLKHPMAFVISYSENSIPIAIKLLLYYCDSFIPIAKVLR